MTTCSICLDIVKLPVNFTCFGQCSVGAQGRGCSYKCVCLLCARKYLQLDKAPAERDAVVKCLICRNTTVFPSQLNASAYRKNWDVMDVLDSTGADADCPLCSYKLTTQSALDRHLNRDCQMAVCKCEYSGCDVRVERRLLQDHQDSCSHGFTECYDCEQDVRIAKMSQHRRHECSHRIVKCPIIDPLHSCCRRMLAYELAVHLEECEEDLQRKLDVVKNMRSLHVG